MTESHDRPASDRRLYCQLHVFGNCTNTERLKETLHESGLEGVLYHDLNDPLGVGLLVMTEDPNVLVGEARSMLATEPFASLRRRPELTMIGRTYSIGQVADLEDWLLVKPRRYALNPEWPWAIWYPLRRKPEFALLSEAEQRKILREHAMIGKTYSQSGQAFDIRLACHGLDQNDNEFVLGLVGPHLDPLSGLVQDMRKSQQTATYIQSLGPFFVGNVYWQSPQTT
ncbi:MAG: chlorite dismutase family protein [Nitrospinota bacterium]